MIDSIEELLDEKIVPKDEISSIGVGASGQIDRENGIIKGACNLDCYELNIKRNWKKNLRSQYFWEMMLK
jgi:hypothetical protein